MKIALFASAFYPHVGGVEELVRQLAHAYRAAGHEPIVLTTRWPQSLPGHEVYEGIPLYRLPMRAPGSGPRSRVLYHLTHRGIARAVTEVVRRHGCEVLHVQCISSNGHYALAAKRATGLPLVVTTQGERTMDASGIYQRSAFMNTMLRKILAEADHVTACSGDTLRDMEQYYGSPFGARGTVVYNGIRLADFRSAAPYQRPRPYVLGIGRLVPQKGFDVLIRAFALAGLPEHDLLIAGEGPERAALEELARSSGAGERIVFVGRAERPQAVSLFKGCDLFVLPSRKEPFGIVNLEAMASGKAVVASAVGGVPEFVKEGETGTLVPADDPQALAAAMTRVVCEPGLKDRLAAGGSAAVEAFDWSAIAAQYLAIYRQVGVKG